MAVEVEVPRRLFSVQEYHRMAETGILHDKERVELIEGEIVQMAPIGTRHFGCVINVNRLCLARLGDRAVVSPRGPVVIAPRSEPQPDLALIRPRAVPYSRGLPTPEDVLLAVEVADTTVRFDRLVKSRLYARAGIAEFWLCLVMLVQQEMPTRSTDPGSSASSRDTCSACCSPATVSISTSRTSARSRT